MNTSSLPAPPYTPGQIASELGVSISRVNYVLATRDIKPVGRAGIIRLYSESALLRVRIELKEIDHRRELVGGDGR